MCACPSAGNGLCSLAELDTWVLQRLLVKFPNTGKGKDRVTPGQDLHKSFRPCYIRAFKDAADYAKDEGEVITGMKSAKQDDYVSTGEFRLFCAYLCIYAAMVSPLVTETSYLDNQFKCIHDAFHDQLESSTRSP